MQAIQTLISRYLEDKDEHIQLAAMVAIRIAGKGRRRISAATLIIHDSASRRNDGWFNSTVRSAASRPQLSSGLQSSQLTAAPSTTTSTIVLSGCVRWCKCV